MDASLALQYAVVALAVLGSAWVVANSQFPHATRRLRIALAVLLLRGGRPVWMHALGRRIAPPSTTAGACSGCSTGCGADST